MKYKTFLLCTVASLMYSVTFSQAKKFIYYFDKDLHITSQSKSVFTGMGVNDNGLIELKCFNNSNKSLVFTAHFSDSTLNTMQGLFQSYYGNGYTASAGNYLKGREDGLWQKWDTLGKLVDSSVYENGNKIINGIFTWYQNGNTKSIIVYDVKNNKLLSESYYDEKGNILDKNKFNDEDKVFTKTEIEVSFPGGEAAWGRFIKKVIEQNIDKLVQDNKSGTCRVRFIVNKDGSVSEAEALTMRGSVLADIVVKAIKNGPNWIPAMQNGRVVKAFKEQPVTFTIQEK